MIDKRIIVHFGSLELGGAERQGIALGRHLKQELGADVEVWGFNSPGRGAALCENFGIPWRIVPQPFSGNKLQGWLRLLSFIKLLRENKPDVLLPYTTVPNVCCGIARRWSGVKICIWNQRDEGLERMPPNLEQRAIRRIPFFVANSQKGADFLMREHGVPQEKIRIIPNGVELAPPRENRRQWRERLGAADACFLVCMLANFSPFKDHKTLLNAWQLVMEKLKKDGVSARLVLAGSFYTTHNEIRDLASSLGIESSVSFLGRVDDVSGLLDAMDLAAYCSISEGCPNAVLECMAAGLPVVATDIPGIRGAVGSDGIPFLARARDERKIAELIIRFAMDPELKNCIGDANRQRALSEFGPRNMFAQMVDLISHQVEE